MANSDWMTKINLYLKILTIILFFTLVTYQTASYFNLSKESNLKTQGQTIPVTRDEEGLFGNIYIETEDLLSLPQAKLLINNLVAGNFSDGFLLFRVYEGDIVQIDTTSYAEDISFYITRISSNIDNQNISTDIISRDGKALIGTIKFK